MHLIRFATAVIILSGIVSSAEWRVEVQRKEKADYLYGKQVYPEYLLNPGRAADWARIGSAGGHRLRVTEVDAPGRPGRRRAAACQNDRSPAAVNKRKTAVYGGDGSLAVHGRFAAGG